MSSDVVSKHKVATILKCVEDGLSPDETAQIFRKQAESINACCDNLIQAAREKSASIFTTPWDAANKTLNTSTTALALLLGLPTLASYAIGRGAGQASAKILTPVNELPIGTYQKAEEILRTKNETSNILSRVEEKKKKNEQRSSDRSVRSIF